MATDATNEPYTATVDLPQTIPQHATKTIMEQFPEIIMADDHEWQRASTTEEGWSYDGPVYEREGYGQAVKLGLMDRDGKFWSCHDEKFFPFRAVRNLSVDEERYLARTALGATETAQPYVDESVPRFPPYDPYEWNDENRMWTSRFRTFISIETSKRFPWIRISRY